MLTERFHHSGDRHGRVRENPVTGRHPGPQPSVLVIPLHSPDAHVRLEPPQWDRKCEAHGDAHRRTGRLHRTGVPCPPPQGKSQQRTGTDEYRDVQQEVVVPDPRRGCHSLPEDGIRDERAEVPREEKREDGHADQPPPAHRQDHAPPARPPDQESQQDPGRDRARIGPCREERPQNVPEAAQRPEERVRREEGHPVRAESSPPDPGTRRRVEHERPDPGPRHARQAPAPCIATALPGEEQKDGRQDDEHDDGRLLRERPDAETGREYRDQRNAPPPAGPGPEQRQGRGTGEHRGQGVRDGCGGPVERLVRIGRREQKDGRHHRRHEQRDSTRRRETGPAQRRYGHRPQDPQHDAPADQPEPLVPRDTEPRVRPDQNGIRDPAVVPEIELADHPREAFVTHDGQETPLVAPGADPPPEPRRHTEEPERQKTECGRPATGPGPYGFRALRPTGDRPLPLARPQPGRSRADGRHRDSPAVLITAI